MWRNFQSGLLETFHPGHPLRRPELPAIRGHLEPARRVLPSDVSNENPHDGRILSRASSEKAHHCQVALSLLPCNRCWYRPDTELCGERSCWPAEAVCDGSGQRPRISRPRHESPQGLWCRDRGVFHVGSRWCVFRDGVERVQGGSVGSKYPTFVVLLNSGTPPHPLGIPSSELPRFPVGPVPQFRRLGMGDSGHSSVWRLGDGGRYQVFR